MAEIVGLRGDYRDLDHGSIRLPGRQAGAKLALSAPARQLLAEQTLEGPRPATSFPGPRLPRGAGTVKP
jgi:hypothetical protein